MSPLLFFGRLEAFTQIGGKDYDRIVHLNYYKALGQNSPGAKVDIKTMTEIGICEPCELKAALAYAKSGWPVVPCHTATKNNGCSCGQISCESPGKHPRYKRGLLEHGLKEATTDEAIITAWWTIWPGANIAVVTGKRSGFDVLDVDLRHGGEDSLSDLEREYGNLPDTVEQLTGGGGRHILFRHQDGLGNKTGLRLGLDVRGEGGYIMAAPSNHASGRKYEWELSSLPGEVDLAEWPEWLLELMEVKNGQLRESAPPVEGEIAAGKRNTTLASLAGSMRQRGMGESAIFAALLIENEQRCKPPLSEAEVRKIATSVAQYEPGQPENGRLVMKVNAGKGQDIHEDIPTYPYAIEDGRIGYFKVEQRGDNAGKVFMPLCNFSAQVVEEQVLDNGIDLVRRFAVEGQLADGGGLHRVEITAGQFNGMNWITDQWGVRARWSAGMGAKDRLREGIQIFSANAKLQYTYQHTGWRKINGVWQYLHGGLTDIQVVLEPPLDRYVLPEEPEDVSGALRKSLALLDVAPAEVTIPLLSSVFLAPLCEFLHPDFVVFLLGKTGSLKSTLAALFLSHFGDFDRTSLPGSWESTDNALERRLSTLKDTLCVVDDYAPRADASAQRKQEQRAQRVIRSMGNLSGRSRLKRDLSEHPEYKPRGLMLSTGEDLPPGQSILARILTIEVERDRLDMEGITQAQQNAYRLPHAMAGYIEWLVPQLDELAQTLAEQWRQHRVRFSQNSAHLRIPEILAYLALGIDLFTSFAQDQGILSESEIQDLALRTHKVLLGFGQAHGARVQEEDPAEVFLSTLSAMLAQGAVDLAYRASSDELDNLIGWKDSDYAYLIPDAARHAVARYLREGGGHFPHSPRALGKALDGRGALVKGKGTRFTNQVKVQGKKRWVLQIPIHLLEPEADDES